MERVGESASGGGGRYTLIRWKGWGESASGGGGRYVIRWKGWGKVLVGVGVDIH